MTIRSTETTVTFRHPFKLSVLDQVQPAGIYRLVIDEEEIPGISFLAYQRSATRLHTPALPVAGTSGQVFAVSSGELARALEIDLKT